MLEQLVGPLRALLEAVRVEPERVLQVVRRARLSLAGPEPLGLAVEPQLVHQGPELPVAESLEESLELIHQALAFLALALGRLA